MEITVNQTNLVNQLIDSPHTNWEEEDRCLLKQTDEDILEKMVPVGLDDEATAVQNSHQPLDLPVMNFEKGKTQKNSTSRQPLDLPVMSFECKKTH